MSIAAIISILSFLKKNWPLIVIGILVIGTSITLMVFSLKSSKANRKVERLEQEKVQLEMTNRILVSSIETAEKNQITKTNFVNSDNSIENMNPDRLPDDFIKSLNDTFKDYNNNLSNNTLSNSKIGGK